MPDLDVVAGAYGIAGGHRQGSGTPQHLVAGQVPADDDPFRQPVHRAPERVWQACKGGHLDPAAHSQITPGLAETPAQAALDVGMVDQLAGHVRGQDLLQHGGLTGILGFQFPALRLAHLSLLILALDLEELPGALAGLHRLQEHRDLSVGPGEAALLDQVGVNPLQGLVAELGAALLGPDDEARVDVQGMTAIRRHLNFGRMR